MVIGLYSLLHGVRPGEINDWFLANYVDAVDWVTTPNVVGMSQFADGGIMASKPYSATGAYIDRMSNYCKKCRFSSPRNLLAPMPALYYFILGFPRPAPGPPEGEPAPIYADAKPRPFIRGKTAGDQKRADSLRRPSRSIPCFGSPMRA